ncbi:MAG: hypothetical protein SW833_28600 [Cyanobacteriota bacterium]|nr:hypothetical protein [Cyanobacteriota bacterium]
MSTLSDSYLRQGSFQEQQLYDHILDCVRTESPEQLLERFRQLFIEARDYSDPEIRLVVSTLARAKEAEETFKLVLNRCCHILVNRWQIQSKQHSYIPELVALFEQTPPSGSSQSRGTRRIRYLVEQFKESEHYLTLQRLARVVQAPKRDRDSGSKPIANLIERYPYLYEHCLLSGNSSYEHQQTVRQIQTRIQQRFEFDLSQFVTYKVRLARVAREEQVQPGKQRQLSPVANPTLLSDGELGAALKQFIGQVEGRYTYRDLAQHFLVQSQQLGSYREFKEELYNYLVGSIAPKYRKLQFNEKLYDYLDNTLTRYDAQRPNDFLILRTSSQLLNFLVVESPQQLEHYIFVDMITNMGATPTVGLLLKVALLCRQVKPHLEKRFSILFNHYEFSAEDGVPWLVQTMENVHIALSIHFGSADVSVLKQIM